ncbi:MAG: AraC family transcriptional regulator [Clostridia bacterium]|nr:AraC family transcriptional regulator [Clostridia bacterium]
MKVKELSDIIDGRVLTGEVGLETDVTGMYACDLLSWVMSHVNKGNAWITVHTHLNVAAVALLTEASCVIIPESISVEEATIKKAVQEGIVIISTKLSAYEICCRACKAGI